MNFLRDMRQPGRPMVQVFRMYGRGFRRRRAHRLHERYLKDRKTGMESWFEFWAQVRYALAEIRIEWIQFRQYNNLHPSEGARD